MSTRGFMEAVARERDIAAAVCVHAEDRANAAEARVKELISKLAVAELKIANARLWAMRQPASVELDKLQSELDRDWSK